MNVWEKIWGWLGQVFGAVQKRLRPLLIHLARNNFIAIMGIVPELVRIIEEEGGTGKEKRERVLDYALEEATRRGIKTTVGTVIVAIEEAVREMNEELGKP